MCLMFDMREDGESDPRRLNQMMKDLEVFISIKPKVKQTSKVPPPLPIPPPTPPPLTEPCTWIYIRIYFYSVFT